MTFSTSSHPERFPCATKSSIGVMAGRHVEIAHPKRSRVRVPPFSNWAIEYLKHLELGNSPRLDHRARLSAVLPPHQRRQRTVVRINRKLLAVAGLAATALIGLHSVAMQPIEKLPKPAVEVTRGVCEPVPRLNAKMLEGLNWLRFGGVQTATYRQKCSGKTFRLVRKSADRVLLRITESPSSG